MGAATVFFAPAFVAPPVRAREVVVDFEVEAVAAERDRRGARAFPDADVAAVFDAAEARPALFDFEPELEAAAFAVPDAARRSALPRAELAREPALLVFPADALPRAPARREVDFAFAMGRDYTRPG